MTDESGELRTEDIELWCCNLVECIHELIGNPVFKAFLKYGPEKLFEDKEGTARIYDEMWMSDWWWDVQLGTTDGYNTEQSEQLHIDYTKWGYAASNKKVYICQMTIWLNRQEAVGRFQLFLDWASLPPTPETFSEPRCDEDEDGDIAMGEEDVVGELPPQYLVAKHPSSRGISIHQLVHNFGCTDFIRTLEEYLRTTSCSCNCRLPTSASFIYSNTRFALYKHMYIFFPLMHQVSASPVKDVIRAIPAQPACPLHPAAPSQFDTVLVREHPQSSDSQNPLEGLRAAQVRAILRLPLSYGEHFQKDPVAYVEWFTPFHQPDVDTGMFQISYSSYNHRRRVSIIPVIHLILKWGRHVDPTWTSANVLDKCPRFYVNPYLRHQDFVLFQYLYDKYMS
ncbi:hypothetical protein V8D89_002201 [Ganoderma adspersum]